MKKNHFKKIFLYNYKNMDSEQRKIYNKEYYLKTRNPLRKGKEIVEPVFTFTEEEMKKAVNEYQRLLKWRKQKNLANE